MGRSWRSPGRPRHWVIAPVKIACIARAGRASRYVSSSRRLNRRARPRMLKWRESTIAPHHSVCCPVPSSAVPNAFCRQRAKPTRRRRRRFRRRADEAPSPTPQFPHPRSQRARDRAPRRSRTPQTPAPLPPQTRRSQLYDEVRAVSRRAFHRPYILTFKSAKKPNGCSTDEMPTSVML